MPVSTLNATLAGNTVRRRKAAGLTQEELAERTGIALRTLARRESGRSRWTTDEIAQVADALGVDAADLMSQADVSIDAA
jgi:transcriptional regulator with XRE-family HTH domain